MDPKIKQRVIGLVVIAIALIILISYLVARKSNSSEVATTVVATTDTGSALPTADQLKGQNQPVADTSVPQTKDQLKSQNQPVANQSAADTSVPPSTTEQQLNAQPQQQVDQGKPESSQPAPESQPAQGSEGDNVNVMKDSAVVPSDSAGSKNDETTGQQTGSVASTSSDTDEGAAKPTMHMDMKHHKNMHSMMANNAKGVYTIQLASFSNKATAVIFMNKLKANGFDAYLMQAKIANDNVFRVCVGKGYATRAVAEKTNTKLRKQFNLNGIITSKK